jgi:PAS domain S-box-containing protein
MALVDVERRYILLNERLAAINDRPLDTHLGRSVVEVLGPSAAGADALLRQVIETARPVSDVEILAGSRAFLASYAPVVVDGRVLGAVAAVVETTERHRAQQEIALSEARFRALVDAALFGVARGRFDVLVHANDAFLRMVGRERGELEGGLSWPGMTPERWAELDTVKARELAETGSVDPYEKELVRPDGTRVPVLVAAAAVPGESGEWMVFCADLTERRAAERERERLLERTRRLQAVTERLSAALTAGEVATVIIQEGMAATGATCGVLGLSDGDGLRIEHRLGIAGRAPGFLPLGAPAPMPTAARLREPVLLRSRDDWLERFPEIPPRGDFEAFAAVPLLFEQEVAGVMGLGFPERSAFGPEDVDVLLAIARQGAQALERARLYEERAYVAQTLQAGLLPRALPSIPGLDLAVRYRPIRDGAEVGGDFYDLVALDDGAWVVVVGDICGKGTAAAVLTGVMRSTVRALAVRDGDPVALLGGVNQALLREASPQALATMACALVRPEGDGWTVELAAGGHPPALILRAAGGVEETAARGTLLGMRRELDVLTSTERLAPGDTLLLYTDGVIDARPAVGRPFGDERLRDALAAGAGRDADGVLAIVDAAVRAYAPGPPRDDKALLAIRPLGG